MMADAEKLIRPTDRHLRDLHVLANPEGPPRLLTRDDRLAIAAVMAEVERLRIERDALVEACRYLAEVAVWGSCVAEADCTALLALLVRKHQTGGFVARLDWRPGDYPGCVVDENDPGRQRWWFETREEAEAAVMDAVRGGGVRARKEG